MGVVSKTTTLQRHHDFLSISLPATTVAWNDTISSPFGTFVNGKAININVSFWARTWSSLFSSSIIYQLKKKTQRVGWIEKIGTLRSNDATAMRTSLKKWICVLSVYMAIIPTHLLSVKCRQTLLELNRPFYQYGGHIELIRFKEYYRMPRGHEHISFVFSSAFRDIFS